MNVPLKTVVAILYNFVAIRLEVFRVDLVLLAIIRTSTIEFAFGTILAPLLLVTSTIKFAVLL
jgi:hypothetical protein